MDPQFESFIRERRYLKNVTAKTIAWYEQSLKHLGNPNPTQADLNEFVIRLREAGLKAVSVNTFARAVNAYLKWNGSPLKIQKLREEQKTMPLWKESDIDKVIKWKPKTFYEKRTQMLILFLLDTGTRISELLTLRWKKVDLDNCLVTVMGKGQRERIIPISFEMRRLLYKYRQASRWDLVFTCDTGMPLTARNAYKSVEAACRTLNIKQPERLLHSLRHTFCTNYLRHNPNLFALQRTMGHSSLEMVRRYAQQNVSDLQAAHVSMLTR
jgi:integrase/recombinase XerD